MAIHGNVIRRTTDTPRPSGSVLVVDDDPVCRHFFRRTIEKRGHRVREASSGEEALEILLRDQPDTVLLDVCLPELDGLETLQNLRSQETLQHIVVILITAHGDVSNAVTAMKEGAFDYVEKPVDAQRLVICVEEAIEHSQAQARRSSESLQISQRFASLSSREREVCEELISGKHTKQAALSLGVSPKTIEFHRARILKKMQMDSLVELATAIVRAPKFISRMDESNVPVVR